MLTAEVRTSEGNKLNVRSSPSTLAQVLEQLENGARVQIIGGPRSAEGFVWWNVLSASGTRGWAVEYAGGGRTLIFPGSEQSATCAGAGQSLFSPGDTAVVDFNSRGALKILRDYTSNETIAQLYDNNRVELLEGPVCGNRKWFWRIYYEPANAYGWIAETDGSDRFLCPTSRPECS